MMLEIVPIPLTGLFKTLLHRKLRIISEKSAGFVNRSEAVRDVTGAVRTMRRLNSGYRRVIGRKIFLEITDKLVECSTLTKSRIIYLVDCFRIGCRHGPHIHLNDIINVREITAILAVAIDVGCLMRHEFLDKQRYDCGICAVGILTAPEDIKISQADVFSTVCAGKDVGIKFVDIFRNCLWRKRFANDILYFWQRRAVAIGA